MPETADTLNGMIRFIRLHGLHTGNQMAVRTPRWQLDISGVAYIIGENCVTPDVFYTDTPASIRLIECSAPAMQAIRAIANVMDAPLRYTEICPAYEVIDYLDSVSSWTAETIPFSGQPRPVAHVIDRIRAAADAHALAAA